MKTQAKQPRQLGPRNVTWMNESWFGGVSASWFHIKSGEHYLVRDETECFTRCEKKHSLISRSKKRP